MNTLYDKLTQINKDKLYPFHMPGHKRQLPDIVTKSKEYEWLSSIYQMDITEINGFDNLAKPEGILKDIEDRIASLYGVQKSFIGVNGSTGCMLAALHSVIKPKDTVILARNCHKSVYHGLDLLGTDNIYLYPQVDESYNIPGQIDPFALSDLLSKLPANKAPSALIITSPTYEGIVLDIKALADICHNNNMALIVDEAHGAHLNFGDKSYFPDSAIKFGADLVIQSLHKTMPAMTQTALLHICSNRVSEREVKKYINYFQTSSPSYILMCSIALCMDIVEKYGDKLFADYSDNLRTFYKWADSLRSLHIRPAMKNTDPGKILISTRGLGASGQAIYDTLRIKYKLQPEMHGFDYVLMMTSIFDTNEGFNRLMDALREIDDKLTCRMYMPEEISFSASDNDKELEFARSLADKVSEEFITPYPPGIPLVVPGEIVTLDVVDKICDYINAGITIEYM